MSTGRLNASFRAEEADARNAGGVDAYPTARLAVIKYAPGQTGVALDPDQRDWNVHSRHEAWDRLAAMTDAALASCHLRLDAVFWMGNHHDGLSQEKANRVLENMRELVQASRAKWGSEVRWIVGLPDDIAPYASIVRRGLAELDRADPQMVSFDTADYTLQPDGLHYSAAAVIRLGRDFYAGWERISAPRGGKQAATGIVSHPVGQVTSDKPDSTFDGRSFRGAGHLVWPTPGRGSRAETGRSRSGDGPGRCG